MTDLRAAFINQGQNDPGLRTWISAMVAWGPSWPEGAEVLEVGANYADWIGKAKKSCPDIIVTALDWRGPKVGTGRRLKGDVLSYEFQPEEFDVITFISSIEHIGLGHYDNDPLDVDGDSHAFERCVGWLKPGGFLYADVPYDPTGYRLINTKCRVYDDAAIVARFQHPAMTLESQGWMDPAGYPIAKPDQLPRKTTFVYAAQLWRKS